MKRIISILLIAIMIIPTFVSCTKGGATNMMTTATTKDTKPETPNLSTEEQILAYLKGYADDAFTNVTKNYWEEKDGLKHFHNRYKENRTSIGDLSWSFVMMMLALETYSETNENYDSLKYYVQNQMHTWYTKRGKDWLLSTGKNNCPAHDDAAWACMGFLLAYKLNGDTTALSYCHDLIKKSYDYWQDGSTANGLWYSYPTDVDHVVVKSIYSVGFIVCELEYYNITKGTDKEDKELHERTLNLYEWIEKNLRRDGPREWMGKTYNFEDNLYFCSFVDNKDTGEYHPDRYLTNTNEINQAGSWTSLFGNTGMCVVNKRLYDMTGEQKYLDKAISTANALVATDYNNGGIILNDRDAWTNSAFLGYFVREVMPLEGIDPELSRMFMKTAVAIMKNAYYEGGFYGADWDGSGKWLKNDEAGEHTTWIATNATTSHVIFAAYYLMKNGYIEVENKDLKMFTGKFHIGKLDESGSVIG